MLQAFTKRFCLLTVVMLLSVVNALAQNVAKIGDTEYATLAQAIAAVPANGTETTIQMLANESIAGNAGLTIAAGKNIVLDLNGKTIQNLVNENKASQVFTNRGTLTIKDTAGNGVLKNNVQDGTQAGEWWGTPQYNYVTNVITNLGTLNIYSGTIEQTAAGSICYAVDNNSNGVVATLNLYGGKLINSKKVAVRMFCNSVSHMNTFNIPENSTVEIVGYRRALWVQLPGSQGQAKMATVTIAGGTMKATGINDADNGYAFYDSTDGDVFTNVTYNITGGNFEGNLGTDNTGYKFISGGTFNVNPTEFVVEGYEAVDNGDGTWTVQQATAKVAQIGSVKYETLADAIAAVPDGTETTITMLANCTSDRITIPDTKNVIIDFAGFTVTPNGAWLFVNNGTLTFDNTADIDGGIISTNNGIVQNNGTLIVKNGLYSSNNYTFYNRIETSVIRINGGTVNSGVDQTINVKAGKVYISGGKISSADSALALYNENSFVTINGDAEIEGYRSIFIQRNSTLTIAGNARVTGSGFAIMGNGSDNGGTTINIEGGTITSTAIGIYHPQNGSLNISGGTINGETAVYVKSGALNVSGGNLNGTGPQRDYDYYDNGVKASTGDALIIDNCGYPGGAPTVNISGGMFSSANANAVGSYATTGYTAIDKFMTGGTYNVKPEDAYIADGYEAVDNGDDTWTVKAIEYINDVEDENGAVVTTETATIANDKATITKVEIAQTGVKNVTVSAAINSADVTEIAAGAFASLPNTVQTIDLSSTKVALEGKRSEIEVLSVIPENVLVYLPSTSSEVEGTNVVIKDKNSNNYTCESLLMEDLKDYSVPTAFTAETATLDRSFTADVPSTLCLPYDVPAGNINGKGKIYRFASIDLSACTITMTEDADGLDANVPYIFMPKAGTTSISASDIEVKMENPQTTQGTFTFVGVFEKKEFTETECNTGVYGYAGEVKDKYTVGQFAKGGVGAYVPGMRAYLIYTGGSVSAAPGLNGAPAATSLPNRINVKLQDANGETTEILNLDMETAEDGTPVYNLSGQRVNNPEKGIYIKNGKKVIIK